MGFFDVYFLVYSNFAEKGEKNGIKFVKVHKKHFQNWNQVV